MTPVIRELWLQAETATVGICPDSEVFSAVSALECSDLVGAQADSAWASAAFFELINPWVLAYLNRVSNLLYVLARHAAGDQEEPISHTGMGMVDK